MSSVNMHTPQMQMRTQDLQARSQQMSNLVASGGSQADKDKKLREACQGFESIFIQKMWEQMRATVPKNGLLQGREEQFWQGMYDQELSKKMASAGGIGLADMMYDQLSRNLVSASRASASAASSRDGGSGFVAAAAPLMPAAPAAPQGQAVAQGNGIYAGDAPQPQGDAPTQGNAPQAVADAQTSGAAPAVASAEADAASSSDSPIVRQFLAELRQRQAAAAQQTPQVTTVNTLPQAHGTGVALAQQAQRTGTTRLPAQGVIPPAQGATPHVASSPFVPPPGPQTVTGPGATHAGQGTGALPNNAIPPAVASNAGQQPMPQQAAGQQTGQQPVVTTTVFTTNIPPRTGRSGQRRPQRMPSGQPLIRTLGGAPASPIITTRTPARNADSLAPSEPDSTRQTPTQPPLPQRPQPQRTQHLTPPAQTPFVQTSLAPAAPETVHAGTIPAGTAVTGEAAPTGTSPAMAETPVAQRRS